MITGTYRRVPSTMQQPVLEMHQKNEPFKSVEEQLIVGASPSVERCYSCSERCWSVIPGLAP
jgi:hypothetical protein